jgi:hypothetical protein
MYNNLSTVSLPKITVPINIPKKNLSKLSEEDSICELKLNFFNPDKFSPPNSWNSRLLERFYGDSKKKSRD